MKNEKMILMAERIDTAVRVVRGFCLAGAIISAIFIPLTLIFKEDIIADAAELKLDFLTLTVAEEAVPGFSSLMAAILLDLAVALIACLILWYGANVFHRILEPMKEGRPFGERTPEELRKLGWIVLIGGTVMQVGKVVVEYITTSAYDFNNIFNTDVVIDVAVNFDFNVVYIVFALVIFLLAYIFSYGQELQRESDETL